jgi:hypothetical protein
MSGKGFMSSGTLLIGQGGVIVNERVVLLIGEIPDPII